MDKNVVIALLLTAFAGLATGIGSAIAFLAKQTNKRILTFSLGLSAGVMIYVSFVEIFTKAEEALIIAYGGKVGLSLTVTFFFAGMLLVALIDKLVPTVENPHEIRSVESMNQEPPKDNLMKMGMLTAIAIAIHNFPEGIATFIGALEDPALGVALATAIAIHNIPEGIAVAIPIYYATGSRKKAFFYSFLSGLSEPVGAIIAYLILMPFINPVVIGCVFALIGGVMVFISLDELLPAAHKYGEHHVAIYGVVAGMMIMAISLVALA